MRSCTFTTFATAGGEGRPVSARDVPGGSSYPHRRVVLVSLRFHFMQLFLEALDLDKPAGRFRVLLAVESAQSPKA